MGVSARRREQRAKKAKLKEARMKNPGKESAYARKLRGDYPPNSPYRTGNWGKVMKKLRAPTVIVGVSSAELDELHEVLR